MQEGQISITGLDKADVLRVLYNRAKTQGIGAIHFKSGEMSVEEARELLKNKDYFDYVKGRVMKVEIKGDSLDPYLYDRDNGQGAAQAAIETLR